MARCLFSKVIWRTLEKILQSRYLLSSSFDEINNKFLSLQQTINELNTQLTDQRRSHENDMALMMVCLGDLVTMISGVDPLNAIRDRVRQWETTVTGEALNMGVRRADAVVARTDQRARRRSGPLPVAERLATRRSVQAREERRRRVRDGDNVFIDSSDDDALRTGGMPAAGPSRRPDTPHPIRVPPVMPVPSFGRLPSRERLVPIEVPDDAASSGFRVVAAVDLTSDE